MLKFLGVLLLLAGGIGAAMTIVKRLDQRVTALQSVIQALELMEKELDFRLPPMRELILNAAQRSTPPASEFLRTCGGAMGTLDGKPLATLWQQSAQNTLPMLKPCDLDALSALGTVLGRYDCEGQRNAFLSAGERLKQCLENAREQRRRQGKVYAVLSVTAGVFLSIILF